MVCFDRLDIFWPTWLKLSTFRLCSTEEENFDQLWPSKNILSKFDLGNTFRSSSSEDFFRPMWISTAAKHFDCFWLKKNVSTEIDQGVFSTEKSFDRKKAFRRSSTKKFSTRKGFNREKLFWLCSTEQKHFDQAWLRKNFSKKFDLGKTFRSFPSCGGPVCDQQICWSS